MSIPSAVILWGVKGSSAQASAHLRLSCLAAYLVTTLMAPAHVKDSDHEAGRSSCLAASRQPFKISQLSWSKAELVHCHGKQARALYTPPKLVQGLPEADTWPLAVWFLGKCCHWCPLTWLPLRVICPSIPEA